MRFATPALTALAAMAMYSGAVAANTVYRCTDETGLVLLTSDAGASRICELLSSADKKCPGKRCAITITKDPDGHLYINGTANGTRVRYPVASGASAVTICIRDQCKAR
ncbi:MAG: hypothetical protein NTY05_10595 [Rhodocyclales bacterium]|nr:hypothetical protein [Rhodocyclales bacterium]